MNCFYHPDRPALGICKSCGKGICKECLVELENGLACKNRCEERVVLINRIIDSNSKVLSAARAQVKGGVMFLAIAGLIFLVVGMAGAVTENPFAGLLPGALGLLFLGTAITRHRSKAQYPEIRD